MAQHDYVIANGTGAAVRSDLNNALAAIVSQNSGATAPATTYAFQFWADTTTGLLKLRNSANSAWITLFQLDGEWSTLPVENGTAAAPSIYFKDSGTDTGFYSPGTDQVGISTGGTARLTIDANGNLAVDTNSLYVDAANNRVGIGTSSPSTRLHVASSVSTLPSPEDYTTTVGYFNNTYLNTTNGTTAYTVLRLRREGEGGVAYASTADFAIARYEASGTNSRTRLDLRLGHAGTNTTDTTVASFLSSGNVGIGTTSPSTLLDVRGSTEASIRWGTTSNFYGTIFADATLTTLNSYNSNPLAFSVSTGTGFSEKARIDTSGRFLVGTSSGYAIFDNSTTNPKFQFRQTSGEPRGAAFIEDRGDADGFDLYIAKSRGGSGTTIVNNADQLGSIQFTGADGTNQVTAAAIRAYVDGTPGADDMPGRLSLWTTADGASSPTERMRITSTGAVLVNTTSTATNAVFEVSSNGTKKSLQVYNNDNVQLYSLGTGTVYSNGGVLTNTNPSDERLKDNIETLDWGLEQVMALRPVSFDWKNNRTNQGKQYGFIAQEVQSVMPELVNEFETVDGDETVTRLGLEKDGIYAAMVKALQEQQAMITELQAKVAALESA